MKHKKANLIFTIIILILALAFVIIFEGPDILKTYIRTGIGSCNKIPMLCKTPTQEIINPAIDKDYLSTLIPHKFSKLSLSAPKGFAVIQELEKQLYYKKRLNRSKESVIFTFRQDPGYFMKLFPQVKKLGISNNYDFIKRLAFAQIDGIKNIDDAFFVILKSIFTPDLGDQNKVISASFTMPDRKGFINYNLFDKMYYFECNVISKDGDFFKVYIKDNGATLDLKEIFAIISTLDK
jgi:hypothetical protein